MPTIKLDVEQKHFHDLSLDILRETFELYNTGPEKRTPKWQEEVAKFENPRQQYMQMQVPEFTMAFANQLKKLIRNSPKVPAIVLTIDNLHKIEFTQSIRAEEIYEKLNF